MYGKQQTTITKPADRQQPRWLACIVCALLMLPELVAAQADYSLPDPELKAFLDQTINGNSPIVDRYDAEVWVFNMRSRMAPYHVDTGESLEILQSVYRESVASDLQPDLVLAVIAIESAFNRFAVSSVGAQGLMQVMPFWKNEIGRPDDNLTDNPTNIRYGCRILQFYLQKENGNLSRALARYNGSLGKTRYPEKVLVTWERHWRSGRI